MGLQVPQRAPPPCKTLSSPHWVGASNTGCPGKCLRAVPCGSWFLVRKCNSALCSVPRACAGEALGQDGGSGLEDAINVSPAPRPGGWLRALGAGGGRGTKGLGRGTSPWHPGRRPVGGAGLLPPELGPGQRVERPPGLGGLTLTCRLLSQ